jgi:integrase
MVRSTLGRTPRQNGCYGLPGTSRRSLAIAGVHRTLAVEALSELPPRLDSPRLFPAARGGFLNLHEWRAHEWTPAVRGAGLEHRPPYALRHTFATFSIAAGFCREAKEVTFDEALAVLSLLGAMRGPRVKLAAAALADLLSRRGLERPCEVLVRWAREA